MPSRPPRQPRKGVAVIATLTNSSQLQRPLIIAAPLDTRIADDLRLHIINGDLEPGEHLNETLLAETLGVSRSTVRAAVRILANDGLVHVTPYRGAVVRGISTRDIEDLYAIRVLHETFAVQRIIDQGQHQQLGRLHEICDEMASASSSASELDALDAGFHEALIALADHALLSAFWRTINFQVRSVMAMTNREIANGTLIAANHRGLLDIIASGDVARATAAIEAHPRVAINRVLEKLTSTDTSTPSKGAQP